MNRASGEAVPAPDGPRRVLPPAPLEATERRRVAIAAGVPFLLVFVGLVPFAAWGGGSLGSLLISVAVYGGLLSLAAGFVMADREQARQCPACRTRNPRGADGCQQCRYDLASRPRFACEERHAVHLDPGLCECGRRLQPLGGTGGIGREVLVILKAGGWLLAFLVGMGLLFQYVG